MENSALNIEFSNIVKIWFQEKFKDDNIFRDSQYFENKESKDINQERKKNITRSLTNIYEHKTEKEKVAVLQEMQWIYSPWMVDREMQRKYENEEIDEIPNTYERKLLNYTRKHFSSQ